MTLSNSLSSINKKNKNLLETSVNIECPSFIVNRIMAGFQDTLGIAEIASMIDTLDDRDCYVIYYGLVSKKARFKKTSFRKKSNLSNDEISFCRYNNISEEKYHEMKDTLNINE